jgi:hypothetical protein
VHLLHRGLCRLCRYLLPSGNAHSLWSIEGSTATILDAQGVFPKAPEALDEKSLTELLADGTVKFEVDPKIGVTSVAHHVSVFGNSPWEILHNGEADNTFFTSDFPVAIEVANLNTPINRIVPLAPDPAIRIIADIRLSGTKPDLSFAKFKAAPRRLKRSEICDLNRLIVRCAEDLILYRDEHEWIEAFVTKNRHYHIEPVTQQIPHGTGVLNVSTQRILARN